MSPHLLSQIRIHFGSLAELKSMFSASVLGMFGSGWMWLVSDSQGQLAVYPTFGTGTLLVRSKQLMVSDQQTVVGEEPQSAVRKQAAEAAASNSAPATPTSAASGPSNPPSSPVSGAAYGLGNIQPPTQTRSIFYQSGGEFSAASVMAGSFESAVERDSASGKYDVKKVGDTLLPLMCVSVHEHAWVGAGYGVWGKEEYMKRFWSVANWAQASTLYEKAYADRTTRM